MALSATQTIAFPSAANADTHIVTERLPLGAEYNPFLTPRVYLSTGTLRCQVNNHVTDSLDLKSHKINTYKKRRGSPFLCALPRFDAKMVFSIWWRRRNSSGTPSKHWMLMHHAGDP